VSAWRKWITDLSGTRQQITVVLLGLLILGFMRGLTLAKDTSDVVSLLQALMPIFTVGILAWFGDRWRESAAAKVNGTSSSAVTMTASPGGSVSATVTPTDKP